MQGNLTPASFGIIWIAITLGSFGQVFLKQGLSGKTLAAGSMMQTFINILHAMAAPYVLLGLGLYVVSTFFWMFVLSKVRLSVAYPLISMSYLLVVILSAWCLHEHVNWILAGVGLVLISIGVSFIGVGLGQSKDR
ncbi:MAG: DMT family transporter [Armatimonadota bacterium]